MKDDEKIKFERNNPFFSLCGLNCALCTMKLSNNCPGCGFGNRPCRATRCSIEHGKIEYCFLCPEYPCETYAHSDDYDSFITHLHQKADIEKAQRIGTEAYNLEQKKKSELLDRLLSEYNDGRRKTLYCLAVNLLDTDEIQSAILSAESSPGFYTLTLKEKADRIANAFNTAAKKKNIELKLRKKKKPE